MTPQYEAVLMHGGGLDSTAVFLSLVELGDKLCIVNVNYGQRAAAAEWIAVIKQAGKYNIPLLRESFSYIKDMNPQPSVMFGTSPDSPKINMRNTAMVLIGAKYANKIYLGLDKPWKDAAPWEDASQKFLEIMNRMLAVSIVTRKVEVIAPFITVPKLEVCKQAYEADREFFDLSMTCWTPNSGEECGVCKHCKIKEEIREAVMTEKTT
jgi:7-cyano-7-deazaguanine synthase in queuosine biosynthesis